MTLDKFIEILHKEVEDFKHFWINNASSNEDQFPLELDENDWFEQVDYYNNLIDKD
jgi:hypothetical protein